MKKTIAFLLAAMLTAIVFSACGAGSRDNATATSDSAATADPWPYNPNNKLAQLASEVYKEINGTDFELIALHAGLECGTYAAENPDLSMISIGADIANEHTPNETLQIASIPKTYKLLKGILAKVD